MSLSLCMFKKITRKRYEEYLYILHKKIQLHGLSWENDSAADLWAPELIQWILRGMWLLLLFFRLMCPCFTVIIRSWMHIDGSGIENTFFFFFLPSVLAVHTYYCSRPESLHVTQPWIGSATFFPLNFISKFYMSFPHYQLHI